LRRRVRLNKGRGRFITEYRMAGNDWADHTGILCNPQFEATAIRALIEHLASLGWNQCRWHSMRMNDARLEHLYAALDATNIDRTCTPLSDSFGTTNLECSPVIDLPPTVDAYYALLSDSTQQRFRRMHSALQAGDGLAVRVATRRSLKDDLARFNELWRTRWKSMDSSAVGMLADKYTEIIEQGVRQGHMVLWCLRQADSVVALIANYQDPIKQSVSFFVGARDIESTKLQGEQLLHAHAIEQAIIHGYRHYEFLRGDERFKFRLGAHAVNLVSLKLDPPADSIMQDFIDADDVADALNRLLVFESRAPAKAVHRLYSQLLESAPGDQSVLIAYANYLQQHGHPAHATQIKQFLFGTSYHAEDGSHQQQLKLCFA